jgi:L-ascorbate metabolism protein UlaG (beta-lactamase superfamily)
VLFAPVGGGPTIGGSGAAHVVRAIAPRLVVPMHYRTDAVNFLEPPDAFLEALGAETLSFDAPEIELDGTLGTAERGAPRAPARVSLAQLRLPFGAGTIRMYGLGSSQPSG